MHFLLTTKENMDNDHGVSEACSYLYDSNSRDDMETLLKRCLDESELVAEIVFYKDGERVDSVKPLKI